MEETSKKMENNNQQLREELRETNLENMNRLDGKMEALKEELSQKIAENNETTISKKVEEEITVIEQKITRADEIWSQTEGEVQHIKTEINNKVTNIEETNRKNLVDVYKRQVWLNALEYF